MSELKMTIKKEKQARLSLQMALLHLRWKQIRQFELNEALPSPSSGSDSELYMEVEKKSFSAA